MVTLLVGKPHLEQGQIWDRTGAWPSRVGRKRLWVIKALDGWPLATDKEEGICRKLVNGYRTRLIDCLGKDEDSPPLCLN